MNMDICILVTGEEGVGKTELINSFTRSSNNVGAKSGICRIRVKNTLVTFHIEEMSSGDFFNQSLANTNFDIILLCFDIINPSSLDSLLIKSSAGSNIFCGKIQTFNFLWIISAPSGAQGVATSQSSQSFFKLIFQHSLSSLLGLSQFNALTSLARRSLK